MEHLTFWEQAQPLLLIWAVFYVLVILPPRRVEAARIKAMRRAIVGDEVVLRDGVIGVVRAIMVVTTHEGDWRRQFTVEIADGVLVEVNNSGIRENRSPEDPERSTRARIRQQAEAIAAQRAAAKTAAEAEATAESH